jgi:adenine-specific DNA-methyltransferase
MGESNLSKFKGLLAELFMFDQADLDFGIYRIMNAKRDEITRFLNNDLLPQVRESLAELVSGDRAQVESELTKAVESLRELGSDPETSSKVKELREKLAAHTDIDAIESKIFSHLYEFFRRYYSEGDFLSLRRHKAGVYAIPYEGEEVKLHWANADQYYIKSSENFRDYTFEVGDGRRVHFRLVDADTENNNEKPANGQERRFILTEEALQEEYGELVIEFEYRPDNNKRTQNQINEETLKRIFEMDTFIAWRVALASKVRTATNPDRTLLERHLTEYTARNTFDYFIHKDLKKFLNRELDFYIKNEVVYLDDIESDVAPRVEQYLAQVKAVRRIAHKLIDFLGQIEDFQKKLWLKKKFVIESNYCVTLDRIPEEFYAEIAANEAQRSEWVKLFAIDEITKEAFGIDYIEPLTVEFLKANPMLVLDTKFFGEAFKTKLLSTFDNLHESVEGMCIRSENFQALRLIEDLYRNKLKCIYIDPPYNTDAGPILYKNGYRSSSWISLIENRLRIAKKLLRSDGIICVTIDDYQVHELANLLADLFGKDNQLGVAVIRNNPSGRSTVKGFSVCHEYAFFYRRTEEGTLARFPRSEKQLERFTEEAGIHVDWRNFRKDGGAVTHRSERPKQFYPIYVKAEEKTLRIPDLSWNKIKREWDVLEQPMLGETVVWPIDDKGQERVWSLSHISAMKQLSDLEVRVTRDVKLQIYRRHLPSSGVLPRTWWDKKEYAAREYGSAALTNLFGEKSKFSFAKSPFAVQDCIWACGLDSESNEWVMDYFAGSGTTAHAVIKLNREDSGARKYVLVEMAPFFDSVLLPRIKKVVYSKDWQAGRPVSREGSSHFFKYAHIESFEDALNNIELRRSAAQSTLISNHDRFREDYILRYMLDAESRGSASLLNVDNFVDPFNYKLRIATSSVGESRLASVDLIETFNYLLGLKVKHIDLISGFRIVEGTNPEGEKVLVIWRNTQEKSNDDLDAFFQKQAYKTGDTEFDLIYVNGGNNLENLRREDETWKVRLIEQEFHRLMFDVRDV